MNIRWRRRRRLHAVVLVLSDGALARLGVDADWARLLLLGNLALKLDGQHSIGQAGAHHLDVIGELEDALEVAAGDAAVEILLLLGRWLGPAVDQQLVLLLGDVELVMLVSGPRRPVNKNSPAFCCRP